MDKNTGGIYRIYVVSSYDKEISYIGISKNIQKTILRFSQVIKKLYNNHKKLKLWLISDEIPREYAIYFKIITFLIYKNQTLSDIKWQILKVIKNFTTDYEYLNIKEKYVEKYNSDINGFNELYALGFDLLQLYKFTNNKELISEVESRWTKKVNDIYFLKKEMINCKKQIMMPWNYLILSRQEHNLKINNFWIEYRQKVLNKIAV